MPAEKNESQVSIPQFNEEYDSWKGLIKAEYDDRKAEAVQAVGERLPCGGWSGKKLQEGVSGSGEVTVLL